jgi:adenosine deaminase
MRASTVAELSGERLGWTGPLEKDWPETYYTYTDFTGFMGQLTPRFPIRPDEYYRIALECFEDLAAFHVVYAEVSFDVPVREVGDDSRFWPIVTALEEARRLAESRWPIRLNYIGGLMRTLPAAVAEYRVELVAQAVKKGVAIVGVDLHGDESQVSPHSFVAAFDLARGYDLGLRAHAGEARGPESIWDTINLLGVHRLAHGARATEDPALLQRLQAGDVTLELCPTSNVRTAIVANLAAHPIRRLYDLGIPITVNSDDPLPFFTNIEREYRLLVDEFNFNQEELKDITLNGIRWAFLPEQERRQLAELIEIAYDFPTESLRAAL